MRHSRDIDDLRADVAANCRTMIALAEREGLRVLVTETVRDGAYQKMLAEKGYAAAGAVTPSFHAEHAGLAFDVCKNEAGHAYDDPAFFARVGEIGKMIGFSWGGDWGKFPDRPHFQWDAGGAYTSAMVRAKRYPPPMPRYEEEEMTQEQFEAMLETYLKKGYSEEWVRQRLLAIRIRNELTEKDEELTSITPATLTDWRTEGCNRNKKRSRFATFYFC